MKSLLALDVSSVATGWAFGRIGETPRAGVQRFAPKGALPDEIWFAALKWMTATMDAFDPDVVAIEAPILTTGGEGSGFTNAHTQGVLWGLQAVIRTVVKAKRPSPAKLINVASARKFFTGHGRFPKDQAKPAVKRRCIELGWLTEEDATYDKADALCVWAKAAGDLDRSFAANFTELGTARERRVPSMQELF